MKKEQCEIDTLLSTPNSVIQYCAECGVVHLMLGGMTLRFSPEYFHVLSQDLKIASIQLQSRALTAEECESNNIISLHH